MATSQFVVSYGRVRVRVRVPDRVVDLERRAVRAPGMSRSRNGTGRRCPALAPVPKGPVPSKRGRGHGQGAEP